MMRTMTRLADVIVCGAALSLLGCGGPGRFDGTVEGHGLDVRETIFSLLKDSSGKISGAALTLADVPGLCELDKANRIPKNVSAVTFVLERTNDDNTVLAPDPGSYTIRSASANQNGRVAFGGFYLLDANCTNEVPVEKAQARSGLIELETLRAEEGGLMAGRFDVTFGVQADKATGQFTATFCDVRGPSASKGNCE